jgi:LAO/AO transport system kinase
VHEHGECGLRALGGRRTAVRWPGGQDAGLDEPALLRALEARVRHANVHQPAENTSS